MATNPPPPTVEPGYLTTEFWISVVVAFIGLLTSFKVIHIGGDQQTQLVGMLELVLPATFYAISRGIRKHNSV